MRRQKRKRKREEREARQAARKAEEEGPTDFEESSGGEEEGRVLGRYVEPNQMRPVHFGEQLESMLDGARQRGFRLIRLTRSQVTLTPGQALDSFGSRSFDFVFRSCVQILIAGYVGVTTAASHALSFGSNLESDAAKAAFGAGLGAYVLITLGFPLVAFFVLRKARILGLFTYANIEESRFASRWAPLFNDYDALHAPYYFLVDLFRRGVIGTLVGALTCTPDVMVVSLLVVHFLYALFFWYERPYQVPSRFSMEGAFAVVDILHLFLILPATGLYSVSDSRLERAIAVLLFFFCVETLLLVAYVFARLYKASAQVSEVRARQHELSFIYDEIDIGARGRTPTWSELWGILCTSRPDDYFEAVHQPFYDGISSSGDGYENVSFSSYS